MISGVWDLPGPGLEPVSSVLAGGFLTTAPPGKSLLLFFDNLIPSVKGKDILKYSSSSLNPACESHPCLDKPMSLTGRTTMEGGRGVLLAVQEGQRRGNLG